MKKLIAIAILLVLVSGDAMAARVKDLVEIQGVRDNRLVGYGLVVGLNGTGDKGGSQFTIRSLYNMLRNMGIAVDPNALKVKNVAAVMLTANLPPFAKSTQKIDCTISSVGDASSLAGGTLVLAPLYGPDGKVYAMAQGPVSVGGFAVEGSSGSGVTKNFPTVGRIPNGAVVERSLDISLKEQMTLVMNNPDFTTVHRMVGSINSRVGSTVARAKDLSTISVDVPASYRDRIVDFVALIEGVDVSPDSKAKAIAHGNLNIRISEEPQVSQPLPKSKGETAVVPRTGVSVSEGGRQLVKLPAGATIGGLVSALNAIGVSPRDLVVILQSIKQTGALYADLEVI